MAKKLKTRRCQLRAIAQKISDDVDAFGWKKEDLKLLSHFYTFLQVRISKNIGAIAYECCIIISEFGMPLYKIYM